MADDTNPKDDNAKKVINVDKTIFGGLQPLTAAQVVTLLIHSEVALGACACGPCACGGPCY